MKKDPKIFLTHILGSIEEIERNIKNMNKEEFFDSTTIQDAVVRRLEIIGEAVKNLPASFKNKYPEIPWKKIAGTRDILIHEYFGVDKNLVWKIVKNNIPQLKNQVSGLLERFKEIANLKCPFCGYIMKVEIPQDKCLIFWKCEKCRKLITTPEGECCVICACSDKKCPVSNKK